MSLFVVTVVVVAATAAELEETGGLVIIDEGIDVGAGATTGINVVDAQGAYDNPPTRTVERVVAFTIRSSKEVKLQWCLC